jgi:hypothetical protein
MTNEVRNAANLVHKPKIKSIPHTNSAKIAAYPQNIGQKFTPNSAITPPSHITPLGVV